MNKLPRGVWMLGLVSLFMDMSSEMAHAVLPLFVVGTLGLGVGALGLLEALANSVPHLAKLWSGVASDRMQKRKPLTLLGYGLAALSKPFFPLAQGAGLVFFARVSDRIGKGIRGAPRDAMVADMASPDQRGAAFGLRQSMDSVGAFAGPLIAVLLVAMWHYDVRGILWIACLPALICVAILAFGVDEPEKKTGTVKKPGFTLASARALGPDFWRVMAIAGGLLFARVSDAFLVLRASDFGLALVFIPLVLVVYNGVDMLASYPLGSLSDRVGRMPLLAASLVSLAIGLGILAVSASPALLWLALLFYGLHMSLSQSVLSSIVTDAAPKDLRGSAFGVFGLVSAVAGFASSLLAGLLWQMKGAPLAFGFFAVLAAALAAAAFIRGRYRPG